MYKKVYIDWIDSRLTRYGRSKPEKAMLFGIEILEQVSANLPESGSDRSGTASIS